MLLCTIGLPERITESILTTPPVPGAPEPLALISVLGTRRINNFSAFSAPEGTSKLKLMYFAGLKEVFAIPSVTVPSFETGVLEPSLPYEV